MSFDPRTFRIALSRFPTGVCVVTTPTYGLSCLGVTVSSFNSVSLDPPLVLWSLESRSALLPIFSSNAAFIINVLPAGRDDLAVRFASKESRIANDKDGEVVPNFGARLTGSLATFDCVTDKLVEAGDHVIFVGRVTEFSLSDATDALGFCDGKFFTISPSRTINGTDQ